MAVKNFLNDGKDLKGMLKCVTARFPGNNVFKTKVNGEIKSITFLQFSRDVENLGTQLYAEDLGGEKVGIIGDNSYEWFSCFLAIVNGSGVAVPFDKGLTFEELKSCVVRSGIKGLFYDDKHENLIEELKNDSEVQEFKAFKMKGENQVLTQMMADGEKGVYAGDVSFRGNKIDENALAILLFTSGTTSQSKAVMLSHANMMANIVDMQHFESFYDNDVNMAFLPFHHSFGLMGVLVFMASGACSVFCDGLKYVSKNLEEYKVTVFIGVPLLVENMYNKIMKQVEKQGMTGKVQAGRKISGLLRKVGIDARRKIFASIIEKLGGHLRLIISGAAPLSREVAVGLNEFGITTIQGYGLTETSPVLCAERPNDICCGSVGKPMPRVKIMISGEDENGIGEVVASGPNIMLGYMNQPEETAKVLDNGLFYTGDLGKFDNKGNLWITGRKKNVIVMKNGKNIFPEEMESLIDSLPYVSESMVFAREKYNELVLWVEIMYTDDAKEGGLTDEELAKKTISDLSKINDTLPKYKQVHHFIVAQEPMIKTTTQKVKRNREIEKINSQRDKEIWYNIYE